MTIVAYDYVFAFFRNALLVGQNGLRLTIAADHVGLDSVWDKEDAKPETADQQMDARVNLLKLTDAIQILANQTMCTSLKNSFLP